MPAQRGTDHPSGAPGGRVQDAARERWRASLLLMAALDRARDTGYRPGSREMTDLAAAEIRYGQAKAAAYAAAAGALRRPTTLDRFTPVEFTVQVSRGLRSLS